MSRSTWSLVLVFGMAAWASFYLFVPLIQNALDPILLSFLRFFIAALSLVPFVILWREFRIPPLSEWPMWVVISFLNVAPTALIVIGIAHSNSIVSAILINTNPLIAAVLAPLLIAERMTVRKLFGLLIGFAGVVLVILNGQTLASLFSSSYLAGAGVLMLASCFAALFAILAKRFVRDYGGFYVTFVTMTIGAALLSVFLFIRGDLGNVVALDGRTLLYAVLIGLVATTVPFVLWNSSLKSLNVATATSFKLLIPVFAAVYALAFLGESLTLWTVMGFALTSIGIYVVHREDNAA